MAPESAPPRTACEVCNNSSQNGILRAREMMFGLRSEFRYLACSECGCLQLLDVPEDLSAFYPEDYYSFDERLPPLSGRVAGAVKHARTELLLRTPARAADAITRVAHIPPPMYGFAGLRLNRSSAIADVGSGGGHRLAWLLRQGFSNLAGFDPYIPADRDIEGRVKVHKLGVDEMPGGWDVIMLNHSFEHMAKPAMVLEDLRQRLNAAGHVIVRVPVADSWAFEHYGADWVSLDAPRHLFLHTRRSMNRLAAQTGLRIVRVFYDSFAFQFWGSEQYRRDIPLGDPRSYAEDPNSSIFTSSELTQFKRRARRLNRAGRGDNAGFVLQAR